MTKDEFLEFINAARHNGRLADVLKKWENAFARIGAANPAAQLWEQSALFQTHARLFKDVRTWGQLYRRITALENGAVWTAADDRLCITAVNAYVIYHFVCHSKLDNDKRQPPLLLPAVEALIDPTLLTLVKKAASPALSDDANNTDPLSLSPKPVSDRENRQQDVAENWPRLMQAWRIALLHRHITGDDIITILLPYDKDNRATAMRMLWQYAIGVAATSNDTPPALSDIIKICGKSFTPGKGAVTLVTKYAITPAEMALSFEELAEERRAYLCGVIEKRSLKLLANKLNVYSAKRVETDTEKELKKKRVVKIINSAFEKQFSYQTITSHRVISLSDTGDTIVNHALLQNLQAPVSREDLFNKAFVSTMNELCGFFEAEPGRSYTTQPGGTWAVLAAVAEFDFAAFLSAIAAHYEQAPPAIIENRLRALASQVNVFAGYNSTAKTGAAL